MKTKAMKGLSRRILTLVLALIMALGSLSGAVSAVALADDEEIIGSEAPGTETGTGEEEPGEEPEPAPETEPEPEPEPEPEEDEEPKWEYRGGAVRKNGRSGSKQRSNAGDKGTDWGRDPRLRDPGR